MKNYGCNCFQHIVQFYLEVRHYSSSKLSDGANQKPHFSLRTLSRALKFSVQLIGLYSFQRALFEGMCMSFMSQLNTPSQYLVFKVQCSLTTTIIVLKVTKKIFS